MLKITRYASFNECKAEWEKLENSVLHYPFQSWWYQNLFASRFCKTENLILIKITEGDTVVAFSAFEKMEDTIIFVGMKKVAENQEITDFGDILIHPDYQNTVNEIWQLISDFLKPQGLNLELDYVRENSATFSTLSRSIQFFKQETSPFITLPSSWDDYLEKLDRKDRHELKRKIRKLENETAFTVCETNTVKNEFAEFIRLHKLSDIKRANFMTEEMEHFFWDIITIDKKIWQTYLCSLTIDNKKVASVFLFTNDTHILLYNSGFDPDYRHLSVGFLIHAFLIKKGIKEKKRIYDFLRGNERYKYDLGAKDLLLYKIKVNLQ